MRTHLPCFALAAGLVLAGCGGDRDAEQSDEARDLSLAPAESLAALNDRPEAAPAPQPARTTERRTPPPRPPAPLALPAGTVIALAATDTITSRHHRAGDVVTATNAEDLRDTRGRVVIPAGATFSGVIVEIKPAGSPGGQGTLRLAFDRVAFGGQTYAAVAEADSLATEMQGRGITGGDAAKVGAGAAVGAVAGRIIGKDTKSTIIGGVVGAAAGGAVAAATKDQDIVLPAGGLVRLRLAEDLVLTAIS